MSKKAQAKPKLSFDPDEGDEDNDGGDFQVRKSKEARKFKKMRQAPGISDSVPVEAEPVKTVAAALGGAYSSESLAQLRKAQMFVVAEPVQKATDDSMEGIELSGEAAEEFVEMTERIALKKNSNLGEYVSLDGGADDVEAIHAARLVNKSLLKGKGNEDRIYTSAVGKPEKRVGFDLEQSNDSDWEDEIIRRGVINKTALSSRNAAVTEKVQQTNALSKSSLGDNLKTASSSVNGEITVADLMKTVQLAVDKLSFSGEAAQRKIEQLSAEVTRSLTEEASLRSKVEIGVKKLNVAQDMKYFFASVVGMLRDKTSDLAELNALVGSGIKERWELLEQRRLDEQEDVLYRLREAGLLVSIGNYTPTAILSPAPAAPTNSNTTTTPEVDEFGRVKAEVAAADPRHSVAALGRREDRRLKDRITLSESSSDLSAADREFVLANRLSDVTAADIATELKKKEGLYRQLDAQSVLYNTKGEVVDFAQRGYMLTQAAAAALQDVEPSLCSVATIVQRLLEFKETYPEEFQNAFIADSAAELFQPLILLDLAPAAAGVLALDKKEALVSAAGQAQGVSFKNRPWFEAVARFSAAVSGVTSAEEQEDVGLMGGRAGLGMGMGGGMSGMGGGKGGAMASMAAQINNLFDKDGQDGADVDTVLTKVVDGTLLPWVKDTLVQHLDTYSAPQCHLLSTALLEIKELCSARVTRGFTNTVVADLERAFSEQAGRVCLPLLKIARVRAADASAADNAVSEESKCSTGVTTGSIEDLARSYLLHQLHRLQAQLGNMMHFRVQKLVRADAAARVAWQALVEQSLPAVNKLLKVGHAKDKLAVLDLCTIVVSLITGIQISATRGAGMSLFDAQLHAWKIPPAQFRPLKAATEKLLKVVAAAIAGVDVRAASASASAGAGNGASGDPMESAEVKEGFTELAQVLAAF